MKAIEVKNLVKKYDDIEAVKDISFTVEKNSFFAFLGPNGAGKSTTINIISTLLSKNDGSVRVLDKEVGKEDDSIRKHIGIVFQNEMLDKLLTVRENLEIRSVFYNLDKQTLNQRIDKINSLLEIKPFLNQRYGLLSGGQKRKADIARALLHWPEILILDEPTTGLDPKSRKDIWELINQLRTKENITIFLTTHYMEEVKDSDKVVIIDDGKIIAEGSSEELRMKYSYDRLKIIPKNGLHNLLEKDSVNYTLINNTIQIKLDTAFEGLPLVETYKDHIEDFEILRGDMDDVFVNITGRKLGDE